MSDPLQFHASACPVCDSAQHSVLFEDRNRREGLDLRGAYVTCADCRMIYLTPVPDWAQFHEYYDWLFTKDHGQDATPTSLPGDGSGLLAGGFRFLRRFRSRPHSWPLEAGEGRRLLDVGCGNGFKLREFVERGWRVSGVDISSSALDMARQVVPEGTFWQGELEELDLPAEGFDFIRVDNVFEHVPRPKSFLSACRRLLKPTGRLLVLVPHGRSLSMRVLGRYSNNAWIPFHLSLFTLAALRRVLVEAGFGTIQIRQTSPLNWLPSSIKQLAGRPGTPLPAVLEWALIGAMYPIGALAASIGWGEELVAVATIREQAAPRVRRIGYSGRRNSANVSESSRQADER